MSLVQAIAATPTVATALQSASARTGVDFSYLLKTAMRESGLDHDAKSKTSTASGLFQFTEKSWLSTLRKYGDELGLGHYARMISQDANGRVTVENAARREEILALRNDPHISALMAGAYTRESADILENRLGRSVNEGELYIAHFLGAGGATKLISASEETPNARADLLFPAAAAANRSIFYGKDGRPRSTGEVYANLISRHDGTQVSHTVHRGESRPLPQFRHNSAVEVQTQFHDAGNGARRSYTTRGAASLSAMPAPAQTGISAEAQPARVGTSGARAPVHLSPVLVQLMTAVEKTIPGAEASRQNERGDERDRESVSRFAEASDERRERAKLLPHSGFSYGWEMRGA